MTETSDNRRIAPDSAGRSRRAIAGLAVAAACIGFAAGLTSTPAAADKIKQPIAVFSGLDKITGRIITFEVAANETVQFGSLQITERVCYSRPPTETPQTDTFIEVDNIDANKEYKRIFTGWMFAGSPSLHALEHPVYDIWLLRCKGPGQLIATPPETATTEAPAAPAGPTVPPLQPVDAPKPSQKPKPPAPATAAQPTTAAPPIDGGPVDVGPPPGFTAPPQDQQGQPPAFAPAQPGPADDDNN